MTKEKPEPDNAAYWKNLFEHQQRVSEDYLEELAEAREENNHLKEELRAKLGAIREAWSEVNFVLSWERYVRRGVRSSQPYYTAPVIKKGAMPCQSNPKRRR